MFNQVIILLFKNMSLPAAATASAAEAAASDKRK